MYRIHHIDGGTDEVPNHFDACDHQDVEYDPADPDVGIFGDIWYCYACGASATQFDQDVDVDEDGKPYLTGTGTPVWEAPRYLEE